MMMGMSLITMTTTTLDLTAAVEQNPRRFGVPAHVHHALRFVNATELANVYQAVSNLMTIPLFASVFRHAETLSAAMDARCYHGEEGRTRLHPLRYSTHNCRVRRASSP